MIIIHTILKLIELDGQNNSILRSANMIRKDRHSLGDDYHGFACCCQYLSFKLWELGIYLDCDLFSNMVFLGFSFVTGPVLSKIGSILI